MFLGLPFISERYNSEILILWLYVQQAMLIF